MFTTLLIAFNVIICILAGYESIKHFYNGQNSWGWVTLLISALNVAVVLHHVFG